MSIEPTVPQGLRTDDLAGSLSGGLASDGPLSVLLVEDSPMAQAVARLCLESGLGGDLQLSTAETLQEALGELRAADIELVLLDLNLPDSCGLATLETLLRFDPNVTVVVVSDEAEESAAIGAIRLGAQDFIVKGTQLTDRLLVRTMRLAIERSARCAMEAELQAIRQQMRLAGEIQARLLPDPNVTFPNLEVAGRYQAAEQIGGDYYDFIGLPDGSVDVVIGDVSGHGIGPSMVMIETRASIRTLASGGMEIGELLRRVNQLLIEDLKDHAFVTLFICHVDVQGRLTSYCSAGHPGYLITADGDVSPLTSAHPPLGILADEPFASIPVDHFGPGDLLALFTDGINEATHDHQQFLGIQPVLDMIVDNRHRTPAHIADAIFRLASTLDGDTPQHDDRTAVIVKQRDPPTQRT